MNKRKKPILTIILVLIILALVNHIIYTEHYKPKQTSANENTKKEVKKDTKNNDKKAVSKVNSSKDYVYDGEYTGDFAKESYTTNAGKIFNSKDLKAPYFNIDSNDASNANKEVNETYLNAVRIFNQGVADKSTYIKLDYKKYVNDDIISTIFKYEVGDTGVTNPIYYTYNFNKEDGSLMTFKKAYETASIKETEIDKKVKEAIKKEVQKQLSDKNVEYKDGENIDTYIDKTYSGYEDNKKYDLLKYIIDEKNELSIVVDIRLPIEVEHLNRVIQIK